MDKFRFVILTEEGKIFEEVIDKVIVTSSDGEITILKDHIPLITTTNSGRLVIFNDDKELIFEAKEGILKINKDEVILMSYKVTKK